MSTSPRRVLVTGANKGIGLAIATVILERDGTEVLLGARAADRGARARQGLVDAHPEWADRVRVLQLDVSDDDSVAQAAATVAAEHGRHALYGIVNNAGIGFGIDDVARVLDVNVRGPHRVCEAFLDLVDPAHGRVVNISSASGPNFVSQCAAPQQARLTDPSATWSDVVAIMDECVGLTPAEHAARGWGQPSAYGLSKALLNLYTLHLARTHPSLVVNACTPGFIETDLTRPMAVARGAAPERLGMKPPRAGTVAPLHLLFGEVGGSGWYFGSDAERSPLDRYRSPGDPPYTGD